MWQKYNNFFGMWQFFWLAGCANDRAEHTHMGSMNLCMCFCLVVNKKIVFLSLTIVISQYFGAMWSFSINELKHTLAHTLIHLPLIGKINIMRMARERKKEEHQMKSAKGKRKTHITMIVSNSSVFKHTKSITKQKPNESGKKNGNQRIHVYKSRICFHSISVPRARSLVPTLELHVFFRSLILFKSNQFPIKNVSLCIHFVV